LVAQDLTESLEKFRWESFKFWLDSSCCRLKECHSKESSLGITANGEEAESSDSSPFLLPHPHGVHTEVEGVIAKGKNKGP